ncbi:MAG: hypothetical protein WBE06_09940 [Phycisphaerae bacterium]
MKAGSASRVINCQIGDDLCGQLHRRICDRIRDDLEANLLYLTDGKEQVLLASLDLACSDTPDARAIGAAIEAATGVPARNVILCDTHTHTGPNTFSPLHDVPVNEAYVGRLRLALVDAAREAVASARPARIGWGGGTARIGYNRRMCWADGTHTMYGDATRPDFTGLEGPDDPSHAVLFAVDEDGRHIAVAHHNTCHATCVEGATFASADFPGEARQRLRESLGDNVPVLYLQGASGDVSPWNMLRAPPQYDGEQRLREVGAFLAQETLRLMREARLEASPVLRHLFEDVPLAVRIPTPEQVAKARQAQADGEGKVDRWNYVLLVDGLLRLYEIFKDHPVDALAVHALRVGDFALATNPCELYCQYGLDIKRRSPAAVTAVAELADGVSGYCPTIPAIMGGGYSSDPTYWCRLEPYAGYKLVEVSARLVNRLWKA